MSWERSRRAKKPILPVVQRRPRHTYFFSDRLSTGSPHTFGNALGNSIAGAIQDSRAKKLEAARQAQENREATRNLQRMEPLDLPVLEVYEAPKLGELAELPTVMPDERTAIGAAASATREAASLNARNEGTVMLSNYIRRADDLSTASPMSAETSSQARAALLGGDYSKYLELTRDPVQNALTGPRYSLNESPLSGLHTVLDFAGLAPVIGEPADVLNGLLYLAEGDYGNAVLSGAAALPFVGIAATTGRAGSRTADALGVTKLEPMALDSSMQAAGRGSTVIEGVDPGTLARSHSISGDKSARKVDLIADSMRADGYVGDPIKVIESNGGMIIVDGHHRAAAAMRTGTKVNVQVTGPQSFPMGTGGWQSIDEVVQASQTAGPNRLPPKRGK